jgi:hypothetical protein
VGTQALELAAEDPDRAQVILHNESGVLFVNFGPIDASPTEYVYRLTANTTMENSTWQGRISAVKQDTASSVSIALLKGT